MEALKFRGSSSSRIVASKYGHYSRLDDVAADQDAISSISSAMQRLSACPAETAKPYRVSDLIPKSWDGSHDKGQFRNFMVELHLWMQAWSDQGERILVRVEAVDKVERLTLAADCTEADFRTFTTSVPDLAQDDNEGATEDSSTSAGSERIRSLAHDRQEIRPEKHIRPKLGVCSADEQHHQRLTHSASKVKKIDTSAPMEIGMAAGTDGEEAF